MTASHPPDARPRIDAPARVVAIGASAGGISALGTVLAGLPGDFAAPILVVQHREPGRAGRLAEVLGLRTGLRVVEAAGGERPEVGTVYVAPPDRHLVVGEDGALALSAEPPVRFSRPSVDPLFRSAAAVFGPGTVAVVLTGKDSDGSEGAVAVHLAGGTVIAQEPATAQSPGMPRSAIETGSVDLVLPLEAIPSALLTLVARSEAP